MNNEPKTYTVTRQFTGGLLVGIVYTEKSTVFMPVGFQCEKPCGGGSPYVIVACAEAQQ